MKHNRRSIRLRQYDYADAGAYYVTICTHQRQCLFRRIDTREGAMTLNTCGRIVWNEWENTGKLRESVKLDRFVVMPNHVHGIIWITDDIDIERRGMARHAPTPRLFSKPIPKSLPTIVGAFKSAVTKRINEYRNTPGGLVWQRNYWERVIRTEHELNWLRFYIDYNPARWHKDKLFVSKSDIMI